MARPDHYSPLQRGLHWATALAVVILVPLGFYMVQRYFATDFDATTKQLFNIHKLIGILLLAVVVARVVLRLTRGAPAPEPTLGVLQRLAAEATHVALYILLLVIPVLGWMGASAYDLLSLPLGFSLPMIVAKDGDFAGQVLVWHSWGAIAISALAAAHIGAALLHRFVLKDGVFQRMWPSRRP